MKSVYTENYNILMKEIKEDNFKDTPCSYIKKT